MRSNLFAAAAACIGVGMAFTAAAAGGEALQLYEWSGYEDPAFHPSYLEKHGDSPTYAFFEEEDEAFAKLKEGLTVDIAHPCSQSIPHWREAGLLEPIDTSRIDAWEQIYPSFRNQSGFFHQGQQYIVPFDWGSTAMTYDSEKVPEADTISLKIFADPRYEGRISIGDNVDDAYALGFLAVGVTDWTKATEEDFQAASAFLRSVHPNVVEYWTDGEHLKSLFLEKGVVMSWAWTETSVTMAAEGYPIVMKRNTQEGASTWVCGFVLPKSGESDDQKIYDYINATLESRVADYLVGEWGYGHANAEAMGAMDQKFLAEMGYTDQAELRAKALAPLHRGSEDYIAPEAFRANTLWQGPAPADLRQRMFEEFEKIKAGE